jgi:hypothetical protein
VQWEYPRGGYGIVRPMSATWGTTGSDPHDQDAVILARPQSGSRGNILHVAAHEPRVTNQAAGYRTAADGTPVPMARAAWSRPWCRCPWCCLRPCSAFTSLCCWAHRVGLGTRCAPWASNLPCSASADS